MPLSWNCQHCQKRLKAPENVAGKSLMCPACNQLTKVPDLPAPESPPAVAPPPARAALDLSRALKPTADPPPPTDDDDAGYTVRDQPKAPAEPSVFQKTPGGSRSSPTPPADAPAPTKIKPITMDVAPAWLRHLHWLLALAMLPLIMMVFETPKSFAERLMETVQELRPQDNPDAAAMPGNATYDDDFDLERLFAELPSHKLKGAFLPRDTHLHWLFAACSAAAFLTFIALLSYRGTVTIVQLIGNALFTATVGIIVLLAFQYVADFTMGFNLRGRSIIVLIFYLIKAVGMSYHMAVDPSYGFFLSFVGFTMGVGLCEELCKGAPLFLREDRGDWHGTFLWGLASGVGFGVSEGIMYASNYYNGISGLNIYLVRFASCVALHAIWAGSVGITIHFRRPYFQNHDDWGDWAAELLIILGVPMILHGLYDTLLKKDMEVWAIVTALASFAYLAGLIYYYQRQDISAARAAMLKEYKRRRIAN